MAILDLPASGGVENLWKFYNVNPYVGVSMDKEPDKGVPYTADIGNLPIGTHQPVSNQKLKHLQGQDPLLDAAPVLHVPGH